MPPKGKKYNKGKRRQYKKKAPMYRTPTVNRPAVHAFKRTMTEVIQLSNVATPTGWTAVGNAIYRNWEFKLNDLHDPTDFTTLFSEYKLNAVKQEIIFGNTNTDDDNSQMILYWDSNVIGANRAGTEQTFLDSQTAKHTYLKPPGKQITMFCKLKQLSNLYKVTDDDYAAIKPRYISTLEPNTPHYGTRMHLRRVDGRPFGTSLDSFQYAKILTTVYLTCRKVM